MRPKSKKEKDYARNVRRAQIYRSVQKISMQKIMENKGKIETSESSCLTITLPFGK